MNDNYQIQTLVTSENGKKRAGSWRREDLNSICAVFICFLKNDRIIQLGSGYPRNQSTVPHTCPHATNISLKLLEPRLGHLPPVKTIAGTEFTVLETTKNLIWRSKQCFSDAGHQAARDSGPGGDMNAVSPRCHLAAWRPQPGPVPAGAGRSSQCRAGGQLRRGCGDQRAPRVPSEG